MTLSIRRFDSNEIDDNIADDRCEFCDQYENECICGDDDPRCAICREPFAMGGPSARSAPDSDICAYCAKHDGGTLFVGLGVGIGTHTWSEISVSDFFCGAGGNTIGAKKAGLRVRCGLNHWDRAIETYAANNPDVDVVERVDISLCDPRRYPSTDIGIFSPECTTHSPSGGGRHKPKNDLGPLFGGGKLDPATQRSRVTMFDVVRFTEYHRYRLVIVENVVEATKWELFPDWLHMMARLGYDHRLLSLNSMFFHPTPQSRDRMYVVFWQKGNRAPNLDYRPIGPCPRCGVVETQQVWKNGRTIGKYRRQYAYACPRCASEVTPFYYAALNALDLTLPAERIGDRERPLKPRTMERIRYGLDKFGSRTLVVNVKQGERDSSRAWPASLRPMGTVPSWDDYFGVAQPSFLVRCANTSGVEYRVGGLDEAINTVHAGGNNNALVATPFMVETAQTHDNNNGARSSTDPFATMSGQQTSALVTPFFITAGSRPSEAAGTDPMPTQTGTERLAMVVPLRTNGVAQLVDRGALPTMAANGNHHMLVQDAPIMVPNRANNKAKDSTDAMPPLCTGNSHMVVSGAAQISMRDIDAMRVAGLDAELMTQGCAPQQAVISHAPFIASEYRTMNVTPVDQAAPTMLSLDKHAVVSPAEQLRAEDCFFRMLQPHEIGAAMAFPNEYAVGGTKRDRVKQYGNAVTPPVMDWIVRQCAATLAPELE